VKDVGYVIVSLVFHITLVYLTITLSRTMISLTIARTTSTVLAVQEYVISLPCLMLAD
jgi:hypothetical protein